MPFLKKLCKLLQVLLPHLVLLLSRVGYGGRTLHNTQFYRVPLALKLGELAELGEVGELVELVELNIIRGNFALHNN